MTSEKVAETRKRLHVARSRGDLEAVFAILDIILCELEDKPVEVTQKPEVADRSTEEWSQVRALGAPAPKTWDDYERGCMDTFAGGHHEDGHLGAFQHGMRTVFSLLKAEFPPAEVCKQQATGDR